MDGCRNSLNCEFAEQPNDAEMKAISFELNGAARQADRQKGVGGQLVVVKGLATQPGAGVGAEAGGQADFDAIAVWMTFWLAGFS